MNLGFPEMIFIFLLALILFGPKKLPEIGRQLGRALGDFKRASNEFKQQFDEEIRNIEVEETTHSENTMEETTHSENTILPPAPAEERVVHSLSSPDHAVSSDTPEASNSQGSNA